MEVGAARYPAMRRLGDNPVPKYLYSFGYQTPNQHRLSRSLWFEDEDSAGIFIEADDPESALAWGEEVSERFIKILFGDDRISWRGMDFYRGITEGAEWAREAVFVRVGEYPQYGPWLARYADGGPPDSAPRRPQATSMGLRRLLRFFGGRVR